jgi:hypothetical protein
MSLLRILKGIVLSVKNIFALKNQILKASFEKTGTIKLLTSIEAHIMASNPIRTSGQENL